MKILRSISIVLAVTFAVAVLAACGGSSNTTQSSSETTPTISAAQAARETAEEKSNKQAEEEKAFVEKEEAKAKKAAFAAKQKREEHEYAVEQAHAPHETGGKETGGGVEEFEQKLAQIKALEAQCIKRGGKLCQEAGAQTREEVEKENRER